MANMKKYFFTAISLLLILALVVFYAVPFTWRYKVTTYIHTPEGIKSGSTVCEANRYYRQYDYPPDFPILLYFVLSIELSFMSHIQKPEFICEAAVIDLGRKGKLVVSSIHDRDVYETFVEWAHPLEQNSWFPYPELYLDTKIGTKKQYKGKLPSMFTFLDDNDPTTARMVYSRPYYINDYNEENYFTEVYGPDIYLSEIVVEITNEEVSRGIEKSFPWLIGMHPGHWLHGKGIYIHSSVGSLNKRALIYEE